MLVNQLFVNENGSRRHIYLAVNRDRTFLTNKETSVGKKYDEILICQMIHFLLDNIYIKIENHLFSQCIVIMGLCPPLG